MHRLCLTVGLALAIGLQSIASARAEVCDKEPASPAYFGEQAGPLDALVEVLLSPVGWGVVALLVIGIVIRRRILYAVNALFFVYLAGAGVFVWIMDDVYRGAIEEGCRSSPVLVIMCLGAAAIGSGYAFFRNWKGNAEESA